MKPRVKLWYLPYPLLFLPLLLPIPFSAIAAPDNYILPALGKAKTGVVLNTQGQSLPLHRLMGKKIVILSFIYATCSDENGCPLATRTLLDLGKRIHTDPKLKDQVKLITLSFDPLHDTPKAMQHYAEGFNALKLDWQFLTTRNETELQTLLQGYNQDVRKIYDKQGVFTGTYSHLLRVYLIDRSLQIRNIYSNELLQTGWLIKDISTLLETNPSKPVREAVSEAHRVYQAGDDKSGYNDSGYISQSIALATRQGKPARLLDFVHIPPKGLPPAPIPHDNPLSASKIELGRKLFFDRNLSFNNTFSCAMCHIPEQGFTSNEMATAVGLEGRSVRRNSPTLYNVGYARLLFHDGRENSLERQVWGPLLASNEMGNPSIAFVLDKIRADADYVRRFYQAFQKKPGMETLGQALASYERSLNAADSPFDRWYYGHEDSVLSEPAIKGFFLFTGKAGCSMCHVVTRQYALFTDQLRHNTGSAFTQRDPSSSGKTKINLAPGIFVDVDNRDIEAYSTPPPADLGYYEISQNPKDRWSYKTPTLRNISLTRPYMHDGSLATLEDVVDFYNQGGIANENLSPSIKPLGLSAEEKHSLVMFLKTLTGSNINTLISDAYAAQTLKRSPLAKPQK
ncbi:MAG: cytochrome c peroxidase [Methylococcaceae bacterium]